MGAKLQIISHTMQTYKEENLIETEITRIFFVHLPRDTTIHFAEHHDVAFYASQLSITPRYLSQIVREIT